MWRPFNSDPETGVLVRVLLTVVLAVALATSEMDHWWNWIVIGVSFAAWLFWAVFETRLRTASLVALGLSGLVAMPTVGTADEGVVILAAIALPAFASHLRPSLRTIAVLILTDLTILVVSSMVWGSAPSETLWLSGLVVVLTLLALHRRQYRLQAQQTKQLLVQTREAQHEKARAAALDERARIAREMHDVLAHSLGALSVQLEVAEALLSEKNDAEGALARVRRSRLLAIEGLDEARRAVAALRSNTPLLPDALAALAESFRRDHHSTVRLRTEGRQRPLSAPAAVSLLATAREALTNAAKHAPDVPVDMVLDYRTPGVTLHVTNEAEPMANGMGYGLTGMRERIALVGGTLTAEHSERSWRVVAEVPE